MEGDLLSRKSEVLGDYRIAMRSRRLDEEEARLQSQGKAMFCILSAGQEIAQLASVKPLLPGDWARGYYRGGTESLASGVTNVREMIAQVLGDTGPNHDPASGGRMMGRHPGSRLLGIDGDLRDLTRQINRASDVSSTGSQMPVALGLARASNVFRDVPDLSKFPGLSRHGKEVALVSIGDASMAEGPALEALFQAAVQNVPLVASVMDNGYGISVPGDRQVPHGSISQALRGLAPHMNIVGPVEGWNYPKVVEAYQNAFAWTRENGRPSLVHSLVTQPMGHSSSGSHERYKTKERLQWEKDKDCIALTRTWILDNGLATEAELQTIEEEESLHVRTESDSAWAEYQAPIITLARRAIALFERNPSATPERDGLAKKIQENAPLTRGDIILALRAVLTRVGRSSSEHADLLRLHEEIMDEGREKYSSNVYVVGEKSPLNRKYVAPSYDEDAEEDSGAHLIAAGIATLMEQDLRVVAYGEDTGKIGGVTTCTLGLQSGEGQALPEIWKKSPALKKYIPEGGFGEGRIWDHAIAESSIIGTAVGLALRGLRPIAEIQYQDYVVYGLQQMVDELSSLRHRTDGGQAAPALVRTHGGQLVGMWHSGFPVGMVLSSCPGLRVLVPRNATQAVSMYRAVMESEDPAFSVEPLQGLYGKEKVPNNLGEMCTPLGHSEVLKQGDALTIITYGTCCTTAMEAAKELESMGINVEVVDLQTLNPIDTNGVALASMKKTGNVLFLDEDIPNGASAFVLNTLVNEREGLLHVDTIGTLTAPGHKPPYGKDGKFFGKPQPTDVVKKVCDMLDQIDNKNRSAY